MIIKRLRHCGLSLVTNDADINRMMNTDYKIEVGMNQIVVSCANVNTFDTRTLVRERIRAILTYYNRQTYECYEYTLMLNDVIQVHEKNRQSYTKIIFDII